MTVTPAAQKTSQLTAYHILAETGAHLPGLREDDETVDVTDFDAGKTWTIAARNVEARTTEEAIRKHVERVDPKPGSTASFVAIPARSWKPVKVTVEQTTVVKLG